MINALSIEDDIAIGGIRTDHNFPVKRIGQSQNCGYETPPTIYFTSVLCYSAIMRTRVSDVMGTEPMGRVRSEIISRIIWTRN